MTESDELYVLEDEGKETLEPIEYDRIRYNDTLDVDRYDIDFDITGEWIDMPLDDDK